MRRISAMRCRAFCMAMLPAATCPRPGTQKPSSVRVRVQLGRGLAAPHRLDVDEEVDRYSMVPS